VAVALLLVECWLLPKEGCRVIDGGFDGGKEFTSFSGYNGY